MKSPISFWDKIKAKWLNVTTDDGLPVQLVSSGITQPIAVESRNAVMIQTHNAVSVAANSGSLSATYVDCDGFDKVGITLLNDGITSSAINAYWSNDGVANHGREIVIASNTDQRKAYEITVKARYLKVEAYNVDAGAAHTMSAWVYLKA